MQLNMGNNKTLFQIEKEINEFLLNDSDFLEIKKSSENVPGLTKDRINTVVDYINNYIRDDIDKYIRICSDGFFHNNQYVPVQTVYTLPDGTEETSTIGTLFAFCQNIDVNARIWWESMVLYIRFDERYLYGDAYSFYPSTIYKPLIMTDVHKILIKEAQKRIINECEMSIDSKMNEINEMKHEISRIECEIENEKIRKEKTMKWRCG